MTIKPTQGDPIASSLCQTHIHKLLVRIAWAAFTIAPEKKERLDEIRKKHFSAIQVEDGDGNHFRFDSVFGQIFTSVRSLQHIWASACYFASLYCERQKALARGDTEIPITYNPDIEVVRVHYELSCEAFKEGKPMPWPQDISEVTPNAEYLELADEIFLGMCAFTLLHEIGHFECDPDDETTEGSKEDPYEMELQADKWAYDWILSCWKEYCSDPKVFVKRSLAIIFALAMTDEFHYLSNASSSSTHPRAVDRLIQFFNDYEKQIEENPWKGTIFSAFTLGLQMVAFNNKKPFPRGPYHGIKDFLETVKKVQS